MTQFGMCLVVPIFYVSLSIENGSYNGTFLMVDVDDLSGSLMIWYALIHVIYSIDVVLNCEEGEKIFPIFPNL